MNDDFIIPASDRERIDWMVAQYRHSIEHLYEMAYMQGQIDKARDTSEKLKAQRT